MQMAYFILGLKKASAILDPMYLALIFLGWWLDLPNEIWRVLPSGEIDGLPKWKNK